MVHTPTTEDSTLDTIFNLKRKLAEPEDDSDSDASSIGQATTNRGRKLKRNARYVHRGRLAAEYVLTLDGAIVEYGGKLRTVIDHNPKRRRKYHQEEDEDEDDDDEDPDREPVDDDTWPYSQVNLKELLIPLSHPSELVTHPAMIRTFRSNKIRVLAEQALESIRAEHEHMTKLSRLLSVLLGDEDIFTEPEEITQPTNVQSTIDDSESDKDVDIMDLDEPVAREKDDTPVANGETNGGSSIQEAETNGVQESGTTEPTPVRQNQSEVTSQRMETEGQAPPETAPDQPSVENPTSEVNPNTNTNGTANTSPSATLSRSLTPVTRPTTRLQTAATVAPTDSTTPSNEFRWPASFLQATPSTTPEDLGLTKEQASEVRRMVQAALERSQEFLRCLEKVRLALVRADKQRKMVWLWCKDSAKLVAERERDEEGR